VYTNAVFSALQALKDPGCAGIFNTNPNAPNQYSPADVLGAMAFGGTPVGMPAGTYFGSIPFARMGLGFAAVTLPDPATSVATGNGTIALSADIVLQSNQLSNGYYGAQTVQNLALILIHELGHVFNIVNGLGGSQIVWDANPDGTMNDAAEAQNAKTLQKCNPK
jgi:hypothetical protein